MERVTARRTEREQQVMKLVALCAEVSVDGLAENFRSFRIWLDSADVTNQLTVFIPSSTSQRGMLCFAPERGIAAGTHSAAVTVSAGPTGGGALESVSWTFEVLP